MRSSWADAHFPGDTRGQRVLRTDGVQVAPLWDAILPLFALDTYVDHALAMMAASPPDALDPQVELSFRAAVDRHWPQTPPISRIERFAFYDRAKLAFAIVVTGETAKYGNIILKKA